MKELVHSSAWDSNYSIHLSMMDIIKQMVIKSTENFILASFKVPNMKKKVYNCYTPKQVAIVRNYVTTQVLNMINAGNSQGVMQALSCKMDSLDGLVQVVTNKHRQDLQAYNHRIDYYKNLCVTYPEFKLL